MIGALILLFVMAVVFPPLLFGPGMVISALLGWLATEDVEARYEDTEWVKAKVY